jgi:tetratricopeptide (TPR) repeat protein
LRELAAAYDEHNGRSARVGAVKGWPGGELPGTVQRLLLVRIETLSAPAQRILALAAVMGNAFAEPLLQRIVQASGEASILEAALSELAEREFIYRDWGEEHYHFSHALVSEVAEGRLLSDERQRFHRRIGEALEQAPAGHLERLAHHFYWSVVAEERADQSVLTVTHDLYLLEKAASYLLQAGQRAQAKYAGREALRHYQRGLAVAQALPHHRGLRIDLHDGCGAAHQMLTELDVAVEQLTQAYDLLERLDEQPAQRRRLADLARRIGRLHEWKSEYEIALAWMERGQRLLQTLGGDEAQVVAAALSIRLGSVHYNRGDLEQAAVHCRYGLALANTLKEMPLQAEAHNLLGIVADVQGLTQEAYIHYAHSLQLWQTVGDEYQVARVEDNIGQVLLYMGDWGAARDHLSRGCDFWAQIEDEYSLAFASLNLGVVALYQGQWAEADSRFGRALHIWEKAQNQRWMALCYTNMGLLALAQQQWLAAQTHLRHSQELLLALHIRDLLPETCYALAEAALGQGELDAAEQLANQSISLAVEQHLRLEQAVALRVLGKVRLVQNKLEAARPLLEQSGALLESLNNRYELGRTLVQLAHLQAATGDPTTAAQLRQQARTLFAQLGARADLEALGE